ncbi:MAG: hypothetical protein ABR540_00150 [Acidimicrobiales bacterium]|nr:hypothetical protein [Actinomycetota bacterium]
MADPYLPPLNLTEPADKEDRRGPLPPDAHVQSKGRGPVDPKLPKAAKAAKEGKSADPVERKP